MNPALPAPQIRSPRGALRSIPFWGLVFASLVAIAVGAWIALSQVDTMTTALTAGTATGVEVYAGQSLAVVGAVVLGAGVVGVLLALGVAAIGSLIPVPTAQVTEPTTWGDENDDVAHDIAAPVEQAAPVEKAAPVTPVPPVEQATPATPVSQAAPVAADEPALVHPDTAPATSAEPVETDPRITR